MTKMKVFTVCYMPNQEVVDPNLPIELNIGAEPGAIYISVAALHMRRAVEYVEDEIKLGTVQDVRTEISDLLFADRVLKPTPRPEK